MFELAQVVAKSGWRSHRLEGIDPRLFEFLNLAICVASLSVMAILLRFLIVEYRHYDGTLAAFIRKHGVAFGLGLMFFGATLLRGWTWLSRFGDRTGLLETAWMAALPWANLPIPFAMIQVVGSLIAARMLVPVAWRYYAWLVIVLPATFVVLFSLLI